MNIVNLETFQAKVNEQMETNISELKEEIKHIKQIIQMFTPEEFVMFMAYLDQQVDIPTCNLLLEQEQFSKNEAKAAKHIINITKRIIEGIVLS